MAVPSILRIGPRCLSSTSFHILNDSRNLHLRLLRPDPYIDNLPSPSPLPTLIHPLQLCLLNRLLHHNHQIPRKSTHPPLRCTPANSITTRGNKDIPFSTRSWSGAQAPQEGWWLCLRDPEVNDIIEKVCGEGSGLVNGAARSLLGDRTCRQYCRG